MDAVYEAPNQEVAFAQINAIKGFSKRAMKLTFAEGWEKYSSHPDRATPHTVAEQLAYKSTYDEFADFVAISLKVSNSLCSNFSLMVNVVIILPSDEILSESKN